MISTATRPRTTPHEDLTELLDMTLDRLVHAAPIAGEIANVIAVLELGLVEARQKLGDGWTACVAELCLPHALAEVLLADPFTRRARLKPRGYAGDAVMLDYVYSGLPEAERASTSPLGQLLLAATTSFPAAISVRERRDLLASRIDATADRVDRPRVLSVACGHLREAAGSKAVQSGKIGQFTALDQDRDSLTVIATDHPGVRPLHGSVRDLLRGTLDLGEHDLIYAAGLFDYLPDAAARSLIQVLAGKLAQGGELVVGNFAPDYITSGYLEAMMDWRLITRSEAQLAALCEGIPALVATWLDSTGCVAYVSLHR
ncbi:MAG: class I SAM-dependent methyltransferase [Kofleriaceae bacterium]